MQSIPLTLGRLFVYTLKNSRAVHTV